MTRSDDETILPLLGAAIEHTRSAVCITTAQLDRPGPHIVYVNPAYCEMTGTTPDEVIGQTPRIMQGPLTSRPVLDRLRADLEAGRPFIGEAVNYRKDGTPFLISWRIDPVLEPRARRPTTWPPRRTSPGSVGPSGCWPPSRPSTGASPPC